MIRLSRITRHSAIALDDSRQHAATGDRAHAADGERALHQGAAQLDLALLGLEHPFERQPQIFGHFVNDVVAADLHALALGQVAGAFVRHDVEADDDRVRGVGQMDVGFGDAADRWPAGS